MKFGKNIARVVELSDPEWAPFWMNYKYLKKKIKGLDEQVAAANADPSSPEAIAKSAGEVAFFKLTRQELRKCSEFFASAEQQFSVRRSRVAEGWRQLRSPEATAAAEGNPHKRLMAACVKLYKDLLLLENYAIMTYCGFSKILKKHDKATGYRTRERFMKHVVNLAPFTCYPRVMEMLGEVENLFKEIQLFSSKHVAHNSEEQLFIDAMRTINTEATKLQRQETADIGMTASEFENLQQQQPGGVAGRARAFSDACAIGRAAAHSEAVNGGGGGSGGGAGVPPVAAAAAAAAAAQAADAAAAAADAAAAAAEGGGGGGVKVKAEPGGNGAAEDTAAESRPGKRARK